VFYIGEGDLLWRIGFSEGSLFGNNEPPCNHMHARKKEAENTAWLLDGEYCRHWQIDRGIGGSVSQILGGPEVQKFQPAEILSGPAEILGGPAENLIFGRLAEVDLPAEILGWASRGGLASRNIGLGQQRWTCQQKYWVGRQKCWAGQHRWASQQKYWVGPTEVGRPAEILGGLAEMLGRWASQQKYWVGPAEVGHIGRERSQQYTGAGAPIFLRWGLSLHPPNLKADIYDNVFTNTKYNVVERCMKLLVVL
jgi:hypothetical protein